MSVIKHRTIITGFNGRNGNSKEWKWKSSKERFPFKKDRLKGQLQIILWRKKIKDSKENQYGFIYSKLNEDGKNKRRTIWEVKKEHKLWKK